MARLYFKNENQTDAYTTPWSKKESVKVRLWELIWNILIRWMPKFMYPWHLFVLRLFGCKIQGKPFIAPNCRIYAPWLLEISHGSCLAARCEVYNLGPVCIGKRVTVAQHAYLCNGTHDLSDPRLPLLVGEMHIHDDVFVGAKALILPGITVKEGCVVGAGAVLTKDTDAWKVYGGNPARCLKHREFIKR